MDFAACEKCGRSFHESFWIDRGDSLCCPACGMPTSKLYGISPVFVSVPRKPSTSILDKQASGQRIA